MWDQRTDINYHKEEGKNNNKSNKLTLILFLRIYEYWQPNNLGFNDFKRQFRKEKLCPIDICLENQSYL